MSSAPRRVDPNRVAVTNFGERADMLLDMCNADQQRADTLSKARLALAEVAARVATAEAEAPSPTTAKTLGAGGGGTSSASSSPGGRGHQKLAARTAELREDVRLRTQKLREARTQLSAQSAELDELRTAVIRADAAFANLPSDGSPTRGASRDALSESLAEALRLAHQRLSDVMGDVDALRRGADGGDGAAAADTTLDAETEAVIAAEHGSIRDEITILQRQLRDVRGKLEAANRDRAALESGALEAAEQQAGPSTNGNVYASEAARLQALRSELEVARTQHAHLRKVQWAYLVSQPTTTGLRAVKPMERVREAMAFLKSTVIHFGQDLRKIRTVLRQAGFDKEQVFKRAHNELKIVVGLMLPSDEQLAFQRARDEPWPVTEELIEAKFPPHKLDTSYSALQEMVVSWDAMTEDERQQLTTAHDVVANAEVLYLMARFIAYEWREKRMAMKQRAGGVVAMFTTSA